MAQNHHFEFSVFLFPPYFFFWSSSFITSDYPTVLSLKFERCWYMYFLQVFNNDSYCVHFDSVVTFVQYQTLKDTFLVHNTVNGMLNFLFCDYCPALDFLSEKSLNFIEICIRENMYFLNYNSSWKNTLLEKNRRKFCCYL